MDAGMIALLLRTLVMYPAAGLLAGWFGFVTFDEVTGQLIVDVNGASMVVAGLIWAVGAGGTFAWSRFLKNRGAAT